jgi:hypothetical protein
MTDNICCGKIKEIKGRLYYCKICKKKTKSGMQDYYDDIFCMDCKKIKARI